jgi:hypothetical protein
MCKAFAEEQVDRINEEVHDRGSFTRGRHSGVLARYRGRPFVHPSSSLLSQSDRYRDGD